MIDRHNNSLYVAIALLLFFTFVGSAHSAVLVRITELDSEQFQVTWEGSVDLRSLTHWGTLLWDDYNSFVYPQHGVVDLVEENSEVSIYDFSEPLELPAYGVYADPSGIEFFSCCDWFGLWGRGVFLPPGYSSGTLISGRGRGSYPRTGANFESVFTPGVYTTEFSKVQVDGSVVSDSVTIEVSRIPEPSSLLLTGLASLIFYCRRQR